MVPADMEPSSPGAEPCHPLAHVEGDRIAEAHPAVVVPSGEEHDLVLVLGRRPSLGSMPQMSPTSPSMERMAR